jgi:acyl-CoA reductase-like NAD-dependent aldehyde dehydrogenase
VTSKEGKPFTIINPSTEAVIGEFVSATNIDVDKAAQSAKKAF